MRRGTIVSRTSGIIFKRYDMGLFDIVTSLANGTFVEDAVDRLEKGVDQIEKFARSSDDALESVTNVAGTTLQQLSDDADKVARVATVVTEKLQDK